MPIEHTQRFAEKLAELIGDDNVTTYYHQTATHVDRTVFNSDEFVDVVKTYLAKYVK